jgi:hypothetical protein
LFFEIAEGLLETLEK